MNNFEKIRSLDSDGMAYFIEKLLDGGIWFDDSCMEWVHCSSCKTCYKREKCVEEWLFREANPDDFD